MLRSKLCVFVSHCILAQAIRANGLAKYHPAAVKPVVQFCLDNDINIMQMPCPESICAAGGLGRDPHGKAWYEQNGLREVAQKIAEGQVTYMKALLEEEFKILAIIGMEFSPACAVNYLNKGPVILKDKGIYVEELLKKMEEENIRIPFIGINLRAIHKMQRQLKEMLNGQIDKISNVLNKDNQPNLFS